MLVARDAKRLDTIAGSLSGNHKITCEVLPADLSSEEGVNAVASRLRQEEAPIDLLVNNAGLGYTGDVVSLDPDRHREQINVNVLALTLLTQAAAKAMASRTGGTVLNVSSIAGDLPGPKSAVYNATKAFVTSFSQSIHLEMRGSGVVVSCLCPGLTRTEFQERAGYDTSDIPARLWQEVEPVVSLGLEAAKEGKVVATPGPINKTWSRLMRTMPRGVSRRASDVLNRK